MCHRRSASSQFETACFHKISLEVLYSYSTDNYLNLDHFDKNINDLNRAFISGVAIGGKGGGQSAGQSTKINISDIAIYTDHSVQKPKSLFRDLARDSRVSGLSKF